MRRLLNENLLRLAANCPATLYVVGGFVRDFLAGLSAQNSDLDLCGAMHADVFCATAKENGFTVQAVYKHTGTVKLTDPDGNDYEYTCFRSDKYVRGEHTPAEIYFTNDLSLDCRRRDFTCNAIYYDIASNCFVDPLGGIDAVREKRLTTVDRAEKVFGEDGLRLMRLARFCAQLGFTPDNECLAGAKQNASMIDDISAERIYAELNAILQADAKYGNAGGHYQGFSLLERIDVLPRIAPELCLGRQIAQRPDFHRYNVFEHSLRAMLYAHPRVRLAALLHDVGKPVCQLRDGNVHEHPCESAEIIRHRMEAWKAPKKEIEHVAELAFWHMYDFDCKTKENKLRKFFVKHLDLLPDLLLLKQADFSGCADDCSEAPTVTKWKKLLDKMQNEGAPMRLKELAVTGSDLLGRIPAPCISTVLAKMLNYAVCNPKENTKKRLLFLLPAFYHEHNN